eukprot:COSAG01_NODE_57513_length_311_cov_36.235849_1_plen_43_part_10
MLLLLLLLGHGWSIEDRGVRCACQAHMTTGAVYARVMAQLGTV